LSAATDGLPPEDMSILVMAPDNIKNMVILNEKEGWASMRDTMDSWRQLMMD
jgi:hypothetical protein